MSSAKTQPARGMRDLLPDDVRRRQYVIDVVRRIYERYGFEPLETPALENIETLMGKYGEEGDRLIFKILKRGEHEHTGEADLALRYDLTVPLARVIAQYQNELPKFFKRYQIQPVWRADRPARARFREFYQCDIDTIGSTSPIVEAEQLSAVVDVLTRLGFSDFTILLNHRPVLTGLLESCGIPAAQHETALVALDKLDKIGDKGVEAELEQRGVGAEAGVRVLTMMRDILDAPVGSSRPAALVNASRIESIEKYLEPTARPDAAARLREVLSLVSAAAAPYIVVDPRLARGLSYYTGPIMEIRVEGIGSLGGGGRYDNLIGMFLGRDIPACGFSLGLERIIVVMTERGMFPPAVARGAVDVMVTIWNDETRAASVALAGDLRKSGLRVEIYPEADKLGKQFKYASSRHVPFVTIEGDNERARGEVAIKDLRSGEQTSVPRSEAASYVSTRLTTGTED
jgi:histidyl-tRNA synthetase